MTKKIYPTSYQNISKEVFITKDVSESACIIFFSKDNEGKYEEKSCNTKTVKNHAIKAKDHLYIRCQDIGRNWPGQNEIPTIDDIYKINNFLLKNKDLNIYAVCDAGIARSGFVSFLLDIKNHNIDNVSPINPITEPYTDPEFKKNSFKNHNPLENRYITSPGLTELLLKSNILSRSELIELKKKKIEKR